MNKIILDKVVILFSLAALLLFVFFPHLDIVISTQYYSSQQGFYLANKSWVLFFYDLIPVTTKFLIFGCIAYVVYLIYSFASLKKLLCSSVFFIVISASIGPGIIVNYIFKDHFGRARPSQIEQFGGDKNFTPVAILADQCNKNCSFSSGHAGMAYYYTSFAYLFSKRYFSLIYSLFLLFGSVVGASRVMMGGHFFSDVLSSLIVVLVSNRVIYILWQELKIRLKKLPSVAAAEVNLEKLKPKSKS